MSETKWTRNDDLGVLRELSVAVRDVMPEHGWIALGAVDRLERRLEEAEAALRGLGWHEADGLCWCEVSAELTGAPHSDKCLKARAALSVETQDKPT